MEDTTKTAIVIDDRSFDINCPIEEVEALQASASRLNETIQTVRQQYGQHLPLEKIAILTALNLTHDALLLETDIDNLLSKTKSYQA